MNSNKIRAQIKEKGMNQGEVAKEIGISQNSLSRKLLGKRDFTLSEVVALCSLLDFENPQEIFLAQTSQMCNNRDVPDSDTNQ